MAAMRMLARAFVSAILLLAAARGAALAGEADVIDVRVTALGGGLYSFSVTIRSNEAGWDSYADRFDVRGPDGAVLGTRVLQHPHVDE